MSQPSKISFEITVDVAELWQNYRVRCNLIGSPPPASDSSVSD